MSMSLKRERAAFAYERVRMWDVAWRNEATQRVKGLPVQVRTQGLGTAVAVLIADDRSHTHALGELLANWLLVRSPRRPLVHLTADVTQADPTVLLDACMRADRAAYMAAQTEALALLEEVKVLADALYGGENHAG